MDAEKTNSSAGVQMSESFALGALLAVVGGYLDAYTYLLRGGVFANAQTGNVVLLGIHLAHFDLWQALGHLIPILAFVAGVMVTEFIRRHFCATSNLHWRQAILAVELVVLFFAGFVPRGPLDWAVNVSVAFICSLQASAFRTMAGTAYATTMCTGNLRTATQLLMKRNSGQRDAGKASGQIYLVIAFFVLGAALASVLVKYFQERAVWMCCLLLLTAFFMMFIRKDNGEHVR